MNNYTGNSRESYLNWVREWKAEYKSLSSEIRTLKSKRKEYKWAYRDPGAPNTTKRKIRLDKNPNYSPNVGWSLLTLKAHANRLLEQRKEAKIVAAQQYLARAELVA